jgi:hypothetical protein
MQHMSLKAAMLTIGMVLIALVGHSQDLIVKKNGEEVVGKIMKVGVDTVHYRMLSDEKGPLRFVLRGDVASMQLATNPSQQQINQLPGVPSAADEYAVASSGPTGSAPLSASMAEELRFKGRQDALMYYKGQGPFWSTAGVTVLFPPAGLVTGIITAAIPPNVDNILYPNYQLMKEPVYRESFKKQAHRRKVGKSAAGFGVGFGALIALALVLGAS